METLKVKRLIADAFIPIRSQQGSSIYEILSREDFIIKGKNTHSFMSGISIKVPEGTCGLFVSSKLLICDSNLIFQPNEYTNLQGMLYNNYERDLSIRRGVVIGYLIIHRVVTPDIEEILGTKWEIK